MRYYYFLFFGTFLPSRRASDNPIAIACFRLLTFVPDLPLRSVPRFISCIAFFTFRPLALLYLLAITHLSDVAALPVQLASCLTRQFLLALE
jgi:hypothetical protein